MKGTMLRVRYEIVEELSSGPIFTMYSARDQVQGKDVAVRVLRPALAGDLPFLTRLSEVVEIVSRIHHPGLERIYEIDDHEGTPFIVGEAPKGAQLSDRIRKLVTFSVPVSVSTLIGVCEALDALHSSGQVHGDIGSHNIAVGSDGSVKLQLPSFALAYAASPTAGAMVLPLMAPYMAPEVSAGGDPTPASDVYSAGVLLFEMLTGRQPYLAETAVAMAMKHATAPTPSARLFNAAIPVVLEEIVKKAMAKDPAARYLTAGGLLSDLRVLQDSLRFGKAVNWPVKQEQAAATAAPVSKQAVAPPKAAAPPKVETTTVREPKVFDDERERGDVPAWLKVAIVFFSAVVVSMIGFWLVFNLNRGKLVTVPNLVKMKHEEARSLLRRMNLNMRVSREAMDEKLPAGTIIQMDPAAEDQIPEGGEVSVVVSVGSKFVEVPDVRGMTLDDARAELQRRNLQLDETRVRHVSDRQIPVGRIVRQQPDAASKLERNSKVRVQISSGREPGDPEVDPMADERYAYTLKIKTSDIEEPVTVRVVMADARSANTTIHEEMHEPEEEFTLNVEAYGSEVRFMIYYDGELVKQITQHPSDGERR